MDQQTQLPKKSVAYTFKGKWYLNINIKRAKIPEKKLRR